MVRQELSEFTLVELVGYEDVETRSQQALACGWFTVRIETKCEFEYEAIDKLYGSVLKNFDFRKDGRYAFLSLDSVEEVEKLDSMLEEYIDNYDGDNPNINWYFGLMFKHDQGEFILEIKDNFD